MTRTADAAPDSFSSPSDRTTWRVFLASEPRLNLDAAIGVASDFGIRSKPRQHQGLFVAAQGASMASSYPSSGATWVNDFGRLHAPEYRPELPSRSESVEVARDYLRERGLLMPGRLSRKVTEGIFETVEGEDRSDRRTWMNHRCVSLRQRLDGLETTGPGARTNVYIGNDGEIIGLFHAPMRHHEYGDFPVRSERNLRRLLAGKLGVPLRSVDIVERKLAYDVPSIVDFTRFVQPVYVYTLATKLRGRRRPSTTIEFEPPPMPATTFAPVVVIEPHRDEVAAGSDVTLRCSVDGGTPPYRIHWESPIHGGLGNAEEVRIHQIAAVQRRTRIVPHTIGVNVTDANGMSDTHQIALQVAPTAKGNLAELELVQPRASEWSSTNRVGVEWCNNYNGTPGLADISGTDDSALGFGSHLNSLSGWERRFAWGNDSAWEQDFKFTDAPGGGTDSSWLDAVHFGFFAGHGSPGAFYFGSTVDDHTMAAAHARWGDGILNWIVLHACQTMRANFGWTTWCDSFVGLHQMFGFHTNTQGSTPPLGTRFAFWSSFHFPPFWSAVDLRTAWKIAATECYGSGRQWAEISAGQSGTDSHNDHLPGFGHVSADPTSPTSWSYYRGTC